MKTILYMAMSVNGYIARNNDETNWSEEEWKSFSEKVKEIGNLIVGRKTFEIMKKDNEFDKLNNPETIIISKQEEINSPEKAIAKLKEKGFSQILIAGGSQTNKSFLEKKLIDEIYLDIEPIILGKGKKLFEELNIEIDLELIEMKKLSKNTIQLHYKIKK